MSDLETQKKRLELACSCDPYGISTCLACDALRAIELLEAEPWNQDATVGLRWMLDPKTCTTTQEKMIAAKALKHIEELEQRLKDTEFLYRAYFVLASEKGVKPGSRELMEAAGRFDEVLGISASGQVSQAEALKAVWL